LGQPHVNALTTLPDQWSGRFNDPLNDLTDANLLAAKPNSARTEAGHVHQIIDQKIKRMVMPLGQCACASARKT
jgi:hypothetical protein